MHDGTVSTSLVRGWNSNYLLFMDGVEVGEVFKPRRGRLWALRLHCVYWRRGEPNLSGGSTLVGIPRLKDAPKFADEALQALMDAGVFGG